MAIDNFAPEIWSSQLLVALEKSLVYAGAPCVNRDYEGEIANRGDSVHIVSISDPTIQDYERDTDLDIEVLDDEDQILTITESKAFAFEIDDIDKAQSQNGGALMTTAAQRAGYRLRDVADQFVAKKMQFGAGQGLGLIDASGTPTNVYDEVIVPMGVALDEADVPTAGRFLVVEPAAYGKLQLDDRFIKQNESGTDALHNGVVGEAAGFTIMKSNNAPVAARTAISATTTSGQKTVVGAAGTFSQADIGLSVTGTGIGANSVVNSVSEDGTTATVSVNASASGAATDIALSFTGNGGKLAIAGVNMATSYAEQINKVEAFRPQKRFADALKGLHLYGGRVVRPECLVVARIKV